MESNTLNLSDLNGADRRLALAAKDASANAYAPYSGFAVGAAVRSRSGKIYTGANLENAAYGVGICAEVSAVTAANAAGDYTIEAIAIVGRKFWPDADGSTLVTPCGRCRQIIFEAGQISGTDIRVLSCDGGLHNILPLAISELLPHAFGPQNLGLTGTWPQMRQALTAHPVEVLPTKRIGFPR
jgi:cytidine deaminase